MLKKAVKLLLLNLFWFLLGRKNLVKFARFLNDESRLDVANDPATNGEIIVQKCILASYDNNENIRVFDVGANVGTWSHSLIELGKHIPRLFIHAFEPYNSIYITLTNNLQTWNITHQVKAQKLALSSSSGKFPFYSIGPNTGTSGFYAIDKSTLQTTEEIKAETIDNYCAKNNIPRLNFIKIDTEGHDIEVIYGAKNMLAAGSIDIVQFEYNQRWIDARHFLRDAFDFFLPLGFIIGKITPKGVEFYPAWDYELETFREANYLAVKQSLRNIFPQIKWWKES